ncbi:uncharacterized protein LOC133206363 isoform X2 [Saccostrea echinata]|uniref:uncharacterized protein LOC133206363 isoform X2 n=1 Tax=Saccostrea echinata TaxID=191078 RepID=UPI002A80922C|nr:uncharacterized protein LOC133206363 isoform X2 [Saccostrea echinata]
MEMLGFKASAPKGVKLSKPPPRKLNIKTEAILDQLENRNFNNGIRELSMLEQSRSMELNNNYIEKSNGLTHDSCPASLNCLSNVISNKGQGDNNDLKQRVRAPRTPKLKKPRPLRSNVACRETSLATTEVNNNMEQNTSCTSDFSSIQSSEEAEDKILNAIERLDCLDQISAGSFKDIVVKFGPQLERENPAFIRSSLACVEEFLKRDGNDASVRAVLREMLDLHKQSRNKDSEKKSMHNKDNGNTETESNTTRQQGNLNVNESMKTEESKVCRAISQDSGYGDLDDIVLWNSEDSFIEDASENLKSYDDENTEKDADHILAVETGSKKDSHEFLSKHFGKPTVVEEKEPLYSTEKHWSDTVRKRKDINDTCYSKQREEFTRLKDNPRMDNLTRTGFGEARFRSDRWTRSSEDKFISQRTSERKQPANGADQESWRKLPVRAGFGFPGKMSTVLEEEGVHDELAAIPKRPKHLIRKIQNADSNGNGKLVVERNPLGPGSDPSVIADVEKGLPKSIYSPCGRRAMFKKYNTAVCFEDIDSDDLEEKEKLFYSREALLKLANSPLSKQKPPELSYLQKIYPEVCLSEAKKYFSSSDLSRPSDTRFRDVKEKKKKCDEVNNFIDRLTEPENAQNQSSENGFLYPTPRFEFGTHQGFPQSSLPVSSSSQGDKKMVFGSNASFIPKDFSECSQVGTTNITGKQRCGFGRPV